MISKVKFNVRDVAASLLIVLPLVAIAISSFHPVERKLKKTDEDKRGIVNSLSKAAFLYKEKIGVFPSNAQALHDDGIIDWVPDEPQNYIFKDDGENFIIYTRAESLAFREYCSGEVTNILYSSKHSRTDLVCGEDPTPGDQKFVN